MYDYCMPLEPVTRNSAKVMTISAFPQAITPTSANSLPKTFSVPSLVLSADKADETRAKTFIPTIRRPLPQCGERIDVSFGPNAILSPIETSPTSIIFPPRLSDPPLICNNRTHGTDSEEAGDRLIVADY
jgi:hypothetical protein